MPAPLFRFKQFSVRQDRCAMKVGTDAVVFGAWVRYDRAARILDIGTGTGILALIAAQRACTALIDAVEVDADAAEQAGENFASSPWADRIRVHRMDVRRMCASERYDLVLANPPYYAGHIEPMDARVGIAKHEATLGLLELPALVAPMLATAGRFAVIIPADREAEFIARAALSGLAPQRCCALRYVAHRPAKRLLFEFAHGSKDRVGEELVLQERGDRPWTEAYRELAADLMLQF